jgi:hypothetical protein
VPWRTYTPLTQEYDACVTWPSRRVKAQDTATCLPTKTRGSYLASYLPPGRNASQLLLRGKGVPMMSLVKRHPIITFFILTYAIGWGLIPFWTFQAGSPFIAALIVIPLTQGLSRLKELGLRMIRWRVRWYWYVVAIGVPLAVIGLTAGLNVALGASTPSMVQFSSVSTILMMFAVRLINPGDGALGETHWGRPSDRPINRSRRLFFLHTPDLVK